MKQILLSLSVCMAAFSAWAGPGQSGAGRPHVFMENKGQIHGPDGRPISEVLYHLSGKGMNVSLTKGSIHYTFIRQISALPGFYTGLDLPPGTSEEQRFETLGLDVSLVGAKAEPEITAEKPQEYYENHYTASGRLQGITRVRSFSRIVYHDVYPHIDWVVYVPEKSGLGGIKYDFEVHPGGDPAQIRLRYERHADLSLVEDGGLVANTELGSLREARPYCFIKETGAGIDAAFNINGNLLSYQVKRPSEGTLIIDPQVTWVTFYGGSLGEVCNDVAIYESGAFIAGPTTSTSQIATFGSFKDYHTASDDAFLARFSRHGTLSWATYFGGTGFDRAFGVAVDTGRGRAYLFGYTSSNSIATSGTHKPLMGAGFEGFIARFKSNGTLDWSTYYGGEGGDLISAAACDPQGNLYIGGYTNSITGIATSGSHKDTLSGTRQDAFVAKLDSSGVRQWGTYYGGSQVDAIVDMCFSAPSGIAISGYTYSTDGIGTSGSHQPAKNDSTDAFLARFTSSGSLDWATYYGGNGKEDGQGVTSDNAGNLYLCGLTSSRSGISTAGGQQTVFGGHFADAFIAKFSNRGLRLWGSYYGGNNNESMNPTIGFNSQGFSQWAICFANGNLWMAGTTASPNMMATPGSYQDTLIGPSGQQQGVDAFVAKLDTAGHKQWATYIGGTHIDRATSIAGDRFGNIYMAGGSFADSGFATDNAYQTSLGGAADAALTHIYDSLSLLRLRNVQAYCPGDAITLGNYITGNGTFRTGNVFRIELSNASGSFVSPTQIGALTFSTATTVPGIIPVGITGTGYKMRMVSTRPVMISDTVALVFKPFVPIPIISYSGGILSTGSYTTYQWYRNGVLIPGATNATYAPAANGSYSVEVSAPDSCNSSSIGYVVSGLNIAQESSLEAVKLFPNPAQDYLNIEGAEHGTVLIIQSMVGQQWASSTLHAQKETVSISHFPAGIYILKLVSRDGAVKVFSVVKQ